MSIDFIWVDIETTGLKATEEVPLELGIVLTDKWGEIYDQRAWLVYENTPQYRSAIERAKKNEVVGPMHEKSGLWEELEKVQSYSRAQVVRECLDWFDEVGVQYKKYPMAGSSIRLDREFCEVHFPEVEDHIHYRQADVSAIKEFCRQVNPHLLERIQDEYFKIQGNVPHRVLDDCRASIAEYQSYLDNFLIADYEMDD